MSTDDHTTEPSTGATGTGHHGTREYEIRIEGHLGARWTAWFDGLDLADEEDGTTVIRGPVVDQAALHGLLQKLRDVGIPLVSLTQVAHDATTTPGPTPRPDEGN